MKDAVKRMKRQVRDREKKSLQNVQLIKKWYPKYAKNS